MTDLLQIKEGFLKKGYCQFPINLINPDFYKFIAENFKCTEENNLKDLFNTFRFDSNKFETMFTNDKNNHLETNQEKERLYNLYNDEDITQIWFWNNQWPTIANYLNFDNTILRETIESGLNEMIKFLYDLEENASLTHKELQLTYYNENCRFTPHTDGPQSGILCSMILYLNENYNRDNGGLLVFNDELITPELGICAIMDLTKHDIRHGVTKVVGGSGRFAILSFPKLKTDI
jgi:Rps23 Pro-64 3,4-dihydroxylase Tpa1-like proline 4-hydroxylase